MTGSVVFPLVEQMRDTINTHGLQWAVRYYMKRIPWPECRLLLRSAYRC